MSRLDEQNVLFLSPRYGYMKEMLASSATRRRAGGIEGRDTASHAVVLPSDMVDNSINLSKPISGWFIRSGQIKQVLSSPNEAPFELFCLSL